MSNPHFRVFKLCVQVMIIRERVLYELLLYMLSCFGSVDARMQEQVLLEFLGCVFYIIDSCIKDLCGENMYSMYQICVICNVWIWGVTDWYQSLSLRDLGDQLHDDA